MENALVRSRRNAGLLGALPKRDMAQCRIAELSAERLMESGRILSHKEVLLVLRKWSFGANPRRTNIQHEGQLFVHSDTFGLVPRFAPIENRELIVGRMAQKYPKLTLMLASYIRQCSGSLSLPDFTTITLNGGIDGKGAAWHRDAHNMGPTAVTALGRHTEGQLLTQDSDGMVRKQSAHRSVVVFDGRMQHSVDDFKGPDRFSIVAFCSDWNKHIAVRKSTLTSLAGMGFQVPNQSYASQWLSVLPQCGGTKQKKTWAAKNWWSRVDSRQERVRQDLIRAGRSASAKSMDFRTLHCVGFDRRCRGGQAVAPPAKLKKMRQQLRRDFGKVKALCKFCRGLWWRQSS
jgi:hypothetical protein